MFDYTFLEHFVNFFFILLTMKFVLEVIGEAVLLGIDWFFFGDFDAVFDHGGPFELVPVEVKTIFLFGHQSFEDCFFFVTFQMANVDVFHQSFDAGFRSGYGLFCL